MSLVLWYSMVAFQCRNVWNVMRSSLGFPNLWAVLWRCLWYVLRRLFRFLKENMRSWLRGSLLSIAMRRLESLKIRGLLCFSGVTLTVQVMKSMSVHLSWKASPARARVNCLYCFLGQTVLESLFFTVD